MSSAKIHRCACANCQREEDHPDKALHHQMNVLMSRMDEQQRRWYAAVESKRYGHGGIKLVSQITGLDDKTIRKGREEMADELADRPRKRMRLPGGGRPRVEKNASGCDETAGPHSR
jgi:hypothetical protein